MRRNSELILAAGAGVVLGAAAMLLRAEPSPNTRPAAVQEAVAPPRDVTLRKASAFLAMQNWEGAEAQYTQAIESDPSDWMAWQGRALSRVGEGDFPGALSDFDRAIALSGTQPALYGHRGVARAKLGDFENASRDFTRAIEARPGDGGLRLNRGQAREHLGDLGGAQDDYEEAVRLLNPLDYLRQMAQLRLSALTQRRARTSF